MQMGPEKSAGAVGPEDRVAVEDARLDGARESPMRAGIGAVCIAPLPEIGGHIVELPPTYDHAAGIRRIDAERGLVAGITGDVLPERVHVDLHAAGGRPRLEAR